MNAITDNSFNPVSVKIEEISIENTVNKLGIVPDQLASKLDCNKLQAYNLLALLRKRGMVISKEESRKGKKGRARQFYLIEDGNDFFKKWSELGNEIVIALLK